MSYSRWSNSKWYTFWASFFEDDSIKRIDQIFRICTVRSFTYKELKEDIDKCIVLTKEAIRESEKRDDLFSYELESYSNEDFEELKIYMKEFMKDVEEDSDLT